ncbi:MAG: glycogen debranching N-terminal domain-containing protein [Halobellus sp.]|uniref:amylo-alpha-1,6-glucosidase n=1 Tax=Halobellus sp. TaxID=1979212 RepID=UPI0035D4F2C9
MPLKTLVDGYTYFVVPDGEQIRTTADDVGGLYHRDTRYLSQLDWTITDDRFRSLRSVLESPAAMRELLAPAGTEINDISGETAPKHTPIVITRETGISEGYGCIQTLTVSNHHTTTQTVELTATLDVDFADLFEVRGFESDVDRHIDTTVDGDEILSRYTYDHTGGETTYETRVSFTPSPDELTRSRATLSVAVPPQGETSVSVAVGIDGASPHDAPSRRQRRPVSIPTLPASDDTHGMVLEQAAEDLVALTTETAVGPVPLAGTPWFVTPFGRDALITAYQALPVAPELAEGTLRYLASHRGETTNPMTEEAPGKIFHEQRHGELAKRGYIPHTPYYGTVDATPLWILLLAETCRWKGDLSLAADLADALAETVEWVYQASRDGPTDPFIYYDDSDHGLTHKAWKDTADSIRYADGTPADRPLAVAEVQGYAAASLSAGASLLAEISDSSQEGLSTHSPETYRSRVADIEAAFDSEFWLPDRSFYAVAKQADGTIVDGVASNIGHCLWTGLIPDARAATVVDTLLSEALTGGWGVRTTSAADIGYSPVSYHVGGVWPHDTALTTLGLANYGYDAAAERLGGYVLEAATNFQNHRLPELYCGFGRDHLPTPYPAACTPQAWAASAPFAILRASTGLHPNGGQPTATRSTDLFENAAVRTVIDTAANRVGNTPLGGGDEADD